MWYFVSLERDKAMPNAEISLSSLLDDQATSSRRFVIEAVPDDNEVVKVTLLTPGMRLSCNTGLTLPSKAIKSIKKTGEVVSCCSKELQAVELTFSDEKAVSYDDVFSIVRDVHSSVTDTVAKSFHRLSSSGHLSPLAGSDATYGSCMVDAMLRGPSGRHFKTWMDTWGAICGALYP